MTHLVCFDAAAFFGATGEGLRRKANRREGAEGEDAAEGPGGARGERRRIAAYQELADRIDREAQLVSVAEEMQLAKHMAGKGQPRKVAGKGPTQYKWRRERKR